ncbi:MAG: ABC transporter permease [Candidatus Brocadiae bacterium]|nr:ABC transporter permease [Candidatus Brocadiia bacterium]
MLFWTIVKVSLKSLLANKLRSFLAILGIILGVASVIAMVSIVNGATLQITERIKQMGTNLLMIRPGQGMHRGVASSSNVQTLTLNDASQIISKVKYIKNIAPIVQGNAQTKYMNQNTYATVVGTTLAYFEVRNFLLEEGRLFHESEVHSNAKVAVLGSVILEKLFGKGPFLDETIKIKGSNFKVIGSLKTKGDMAGMDEHIMIPLGTAMKQVFGLTYLRGIDVQVETEEKIDEVEEEITSLLQKLHRLKPDDEPDFSIRNQKEQLENLQATTQTFTLLLGGIAAISLLVGGIGIMNIMLVTVTERTREIGIRKAIGAADQDILQQFLIEASIISGLGGLFGILVGVGISVGIESIFPTFSTKVDYTSIVISFVFSAMVGIFFGYYPAQKASSLNPIDALRYE